MNDISQSMLELRVADLELLLLQAQGNFRNIMAHVRCAICDEAFGELRWMLGEIGGEQEVVHTECFDQEEAKEKNATTRVRASIIANKLFEDLPWKSTREEDLRYEAEGFLLADHHPDL